MFSSCRLCSPRSGLRGNGESGSSCEGGLTETLLRLKRAEDDELNTVEPSLTPVIMGALLDLRSAPPPGPTAHALGSTSIRSISAAVQAQSPGHSCYSRPLKA